MVDFYGFHVGIYTSPMDSMGNVQARWKTSREVSEPMLDKKSVTELLQEVLFFLECAENSSCLQAESWLRPALK